LIGDQCCLAAPAKFYLAYNSTEVQKSAKIEKIYPLISILTFASPSLGGAVENVTGVHIKGIFALHARSRPNITTSVNVRQTYCRNEKVYFYDSQKYIITVYISEQRGLVSQTLQKVVSHCKLFLSRNF